MCIAAHCRSATNRRPYSSANWWQVNKLREAKAEAAKAEAEKMKKKERPPFIPPSNLAGWLEPLGCPSPSRVLRRFLQAEKEKKKADKEAAAVAKAKK